tara:strand:+ start:6522 stop:7757 length:1236 start_codon:yes stop_codon:yes gene_type:complete
MKNYLLGVFKRSSLNISELLLSVTLCSLVLPRIINSITIGLFFLVSFYLFLRRNEQRLYFNRLIVLFFIFFIFCSLTSLWSVDFNKSFNGITRILSFLLLPLAFLLNPERIRREKVIRNFILGIFILSLYLLVVAVLNYWSLSNYEVFFYHNLSNSSAEMNAIYFSVFVSFSLLYLLLNMETKFDKIALVFFAVILVLLSSKTIIFVSLLLSIIVAISEKSLILNKTLILVFLVLVFIGSLFFKKRIVFELTNSNLTEVVTKQEFGWEYKWSGLGIRALQWRVFYELMIEDQVMLQGYGLKAADKRISEKHKNLKLYSGLIGIDFHNQYLQFIAEIGIIGLSIYVLIFITLLKKAIKDKDLALMVFAILIISVCFSEVFLWRQRGMVFFIVMSLLFFQPKYKEQVRISTKD